MNFTVIIPVAPFDNGWRTLINDLSFLGKNDECLLVSSVDLSTELNLMAVRGGLACSVKWIYSEVGRAKQQNIAVLNAKNNYLWFVHCDSRITFDSFNELKKKLATNENSFCYFNLKFASDGPRYMKINEWGVFIRSNLLKMPFGDQAFCLHKDIFFKLGQFNENASYGEDHLLVWSAHQNGIKVKCIGKYVTTSARKYQRLGWGATTFKHVMMTYKQAIPQFFKLIKSYP